ncbi:MAG: aspartyl/glutamyl-tRNA amidotransferase subunit B [Omnitrophica bacterium RIFCSPHIGHO2_02_FULL_46_20]|nr:MAG: aspartyl/glutamyl-tRNA amidotransferase subunit B [Omnitrophica bacterium RIFCSPHIGHO2_02_FULL_46_20]
MNTTYETVIGLEVHLQLRTETKVFCGCSTKFGSRPNSQTCPVCLGFPGSLPVLNEKAFLYSIKAALALNCAIQSLVKFDRKNYYYPDLPKNFQISQYDMPLSYNGSLEITSGGDRKRVRIKRIHLEEDAGKLTHPAKASYSLVDFNRAGMPLLEIVTEPDISSPQEAYDYLTALKAILQYLRISDCDMEKGSLRCDANASIRKSGEKKLGVKVEVKNMNSFRWVREALQYEADRQVSLLEAKENIIQETRLWDAGKMATISMRSKEEAQDYRYFPEPDLVPFMVEKTIIEEIRKALPELPEARTNRFVKDYSLSEYDAKILTSQIDLADYFEECAKQYENKKTIANWITCDIMAQMNIKNSGIIELGVLSKNLIGLLEMIDSQEISGKTAKDVLIEMIETKKNAYEIVESKGLLQISDRERIDQIIKNVLSKNGKSVNDYKNGKKNAMTFLVGQVMRQTQGKANPSIVNEILKKHLAE